VDVFFDGTNLGFAGTDQTGSFTGFTTTVPASASPGSHTISLVERDNSKYAQKNFLVRTDWAGFRGGPRHRGYNAFENVLSPSTVPGLDQAWLGATGAGSFGTQGPWNVVALISSGVVTAVPLLMFNAAARRLPLSLVGMLQYIAPTMQFLLGVLIFGEQMPTARWWGFALVWLALAILTVDGVRSGRVNALARRAQEAG